MYLSRMVNHEPIRLIKHKDNMIGRLLVFLGLLVYNVAWGQLTSPADYFGYEIGDQFTYVYQAENYFKTLAEESDHLSVAHYGSSYEGRPLYVAYISSPGNLARLDAIKESNQSKAGLTESRSINDQPIIIWLSYNIHGNEAVSTETAIKTAYTLVSEADSTYKDWLDNAVIIIDPCLNPDGHTRYVQFYRERLGFKPNPLDFTREHMEPWPGGRSNHYLFDLNRDWAWLTQKESRERIQILNQWLPHIHVDFHEMGINSPYYFAPSAEPIHENITPWQREFQQKVGDHLSAVFDEKKWLYFTGEYFDLFYPSYGDTYPSFNGAIGMTYEQGGSGRAGLAVINAKGDTLTLAERILHHHIAGLHTIELAVRYKSRLIKEFEDYFRQSQDSPMGTYKAYVIKNQNNHQTQRLTAFLDQHQIRFGYGSKVHRIPRAFSYQKQANESIDIDENDIVLSSYQPKSRLLQTLFEPQTHLPDSNTYDITAWAIPYAWGLEAWAVSSNVEPARSELNPIKQSPINGTTYAYALHWKDISDSQFLGQCLQENIAMKVNKKTMVYGDVTLPPGTLLFPPSRSSANHYEKLIALAGRHGKALIPIPSGQPDSGPAWGSAQVVDIDKPSIGILSGKGTSSYSVGNYWHFMEMELQYPVHMIEQNILRPAILDKIDILILPSGYGSDYLNEKQINMIKSWVNNGGTVIAIENAVRRLQEHDAFSIAMKEKAPEDDDDEDASDTLTIKHHNDRLKHYISYQNPGVILRVNLDNTHPIGYGYNEKMYIIKTNNNLYNALDNGWNIGVCSEDPIVSGFVGHRLKAQMQNFLVFGEESIGSGKVIYFTDDPIFRSFWEGGKLMVSNAIFFGGLAD